MSEFKDSQKLNWRQVFTKISNVLECTVSSLKIIMGELEAIAKEIGSIAVLISGFGLSLWKTPKKNLPETLLIMAPAVLLLSGAIYFQDLLPLIAIPLYFLILTVLSSMYFYKLSDRLVKVSRVWYIIGVVILIASLVWRND